LIKTTDPFSKQAQDFDLHVVQAFDEGVNLALDGDPDTVHPFQQLEKPTEGRTGGRLVDWVRHGVVLSGSVLAHATLRHRIDAQGSRHHREQPLHPRGVFHKQRGDKKQRIFEKPQAPFHLGLRFLGLHHRAITEWARLNIGPQNKAGLVWLQMPKLRVLRPDLCFALPVDGLDGRGGGRAACTSRVFLCNQGGAVNLVRPPRLCHSSERGWGGLRRLKPFGLQVKEWREDRLLCALLRLADRGLGPLQSRL